MNKISKLASVLNIVVFVALIFALSLWNIFGEKDNQIAEKENREPASKPIMTAVNLVSGQYFKDMENFISDSFIQRENFMALASSLKKLYGIPSPSKAQIITAGGQNVGGNTDTNTINTEDDLLILSDRIMELYTLDKESTIHYTDMLSTARQNLLEEVSIYTMLVPIQSQFLTDEKLKNLSDDQLKAIKYIYSSLDDGINTVDAYSHIAAHQDEYIYYRTDHHWTALGAYYGYESFCETAGLEPVPLSQYDSATASEYVGRLATLHLSGDTSLRPDDVTYYYPFTSYDMDVYYYDGEDGPLKSYKGSVIDEGYANDSQKYGIFMGGDSALSVIKTEAGTGQSILVVKDSYGNAFVPFLLPHYSSIYVADPRHYKESLVSLVRDNGIDTVLFLNYIKTPNIPEFAQQAKALFDND